MVCSDSETVCLGEGVGIFFGVCPCLLSLPHSTISLAYFVSPHLPLQKRRQYVGLRKQEKRPRINEQIRAREVLLVSDDGAETLSIEEALARAAEEEVDLIEVSPKANPPVVKFGDIGQYLYQQKKKERKQNAHNKQTEVKTLRFGFRTDRHDLDRLVDRAREFLAERHLVKFVVRLRGRELTNKSYARQKLAALVEQLADVSEVEREIRAQGNQFIVIIRGKRAGGEKEKEQQEQEDA